MIEVISSWAKSLGVTIVLVSILEMILPNNKTKKYIRVVLGLFVIFNIIAPFIQNKENLSLASINIEDYYTEGNSNTNTVGTINSNSKSNNETFTPEDLACSFQETAISCLLERADKALDQYDTRMLVLAGGVAANSCLRRRVQEMIADHHLDVECVIPPLSCCTDNAAMIGVAGTIAYEHGVRASADVTANPSLDIEA